MTDPAAPASRPLLRVIHGDATPEELAAVVAVLAARGAHPVVAVASGGQRGPRAGWTDRRTMLRTPLYVGPGTWAASGRVPGVRTKAGA